MKIDKLFQEKVYLQLLIKDIHDFRSLNPNCDSLECKLNDYISKLEELNIQIDEELSHQ